MASSRKMADEARAELQLAVYWGNKDLAELLSQHGGHE
jgi:hypothetical protein